MVMSGGKPEAEKHRYLGDFMIRNRTFHERPNCKLIEN